jgi:hypothetical protein
MDTTSLVDIGLSYFDVRRQKRGIPIEYICKWNEKHYQRFGVYSRDDRALLLSQAGTDPIDVPNDQIHVAISGASCHQQFTAAHFPAMIARTRQELKKLAPASHIHLMAGGSAWAGMTLFCSICSICSILFYFVLFCSILFYFVLFFALLFLSVE